MRLEKDMDHSYYNVSTIKLLKKNNWRLSGGIEMIGEHDIEESG